jgi:hypothetical protein
MAYPFPTTTDYVDQVNSSSYFSAEITSLMKKVPPSPERFYGSQIDDYIELSVFDAQENINLWQPVYQDETYQSRTVEYQDIQNNTISVTYNEFIPSFTLYENAKILLDPRLDLARYGIQNGSYRVVYNFLSNVVGAHDKQCLVIKQVSPSRKEIKTSLILEKENFNDQDKIDFQSEYDCYVSGKIEARDIIPYFEYYLKQTYLLNFVNGTPDDVLNTFDKAYAIIGGDGLYKLMNEIYNGFVIPANSLNNLPKDIRFIGIADYIKTFLYENYAECYTSDQYSKILDTIVSETIKIRLKNIHDVDNNDTLICYSYLYTIFNQQIQQYFIDIKSEYDKKYVGALKNSINFGQNLTIKILSFKLFSDGTLVFKLQDQLPNTIGVNSTFWIVNTSLTPVVQNIVLTTTPTYNTFSIKSPNVNLKVNDKKTSLSVNYSESDVTTTEDVDLILKQRFSNIFVDYTNFENFVIYSSAKTRIVIYKNKLMTIKGKQSSIDELNAASYSDQYTTDKLDLLTKEINDIKLSFDGYEYYLWTNSYYNNIDRFPQSYEDDADEYDANNRDSLINNLPTYLLTDSNNDDFLIFLSMIGHHFDNIYIYIDKFPMLSYNSFGTDTVIPNKILDGMLSSFGWKMQSSVNDVSLTSNYLQGSNYASIADKTNIINNRILNSLPAILKSKGTVESVKLLLACYGVPNNIINIREFGSYSDVSQSLYSFDRNAYLLHLNTDSYILTPYDPTIKTVEFKFAFSNRYSKLYAQQSKIDLIRKFPDSSSSYDYRIYAYKESLGDNGKVVFEIGGNEISSDLLPIFDGNVYSVMVRRNDPSSNYTGSSNVNEIPTVYDLFVEINQDGENRLLSVNSKTLEYDQNDAFTKGSVRFLRLGSSQFSGSVDKLNLWTVPISNDDFKEHGNNFDSYYENDYDSIRQNLYLRLAYNYPREINTSVELYQYSSSAATLTCYLYNIPTKSPNKANTVYDPLIDNPDLYDETLVVRSMYNGSYSTSSLYPYANICLGETSSAFPYNFIEYNVNQSYRMSNYGPNLLWNNKISIEDHQDVSALTPFEKSTKTTVDTDSPLVGVFMSPVSNKNEEILRYFGDTNVLSELGDPRQEFSSSYSLLEEMRAAYYSAGSPTYSGRILYQEFTSIYKLYFDSSIFESIRNVIAARNTLLSGILIEPSILERIKFPHKPIQSLIVEDTVEYSNLINSCSAATITVWRNDQNQTENSSSYQQFVDKKSIVAVPTSQSLIINNNFQNFQAGYSYINDVSSYEELWANSELYSSTGFGIMYIDVAVTGSLSGSLEVSESVPHFTWMLPYSSSVQDYDPSGSAYSYTKILNKLIITPKKAYDLDPYQLGTPFRGATQNFLGNRHNPIHWDLFKVTADDGVKYGYFVKSKQTVNYTVDECGNPDKSLPVTSTIVTNTSVSTGNNGVLTVQ